MGTIALTRTMINKKQKTKNKKQKTKNKTASAIRNEWQNNTFGCS
jgi:hypothetical protein